MTVALINNTSRYQGLSSDQKPAGVARGSTFFEEDTGFEYKYTGQAWAKEIVESRILSGSGDVLYSKVVDTDNQRTAILQADATYTGEWVSTSDFVMAIIDVVTDQDSATNGLVIELSADGVNVVHSHSFSILDNSPAGHHYPSELELNYYRIKYTNGGIIQTVFKLYSTLFDRMVEEGHVHGLDYALKDDHPAPIVRAVQTGKKPNGDYVNAEYTSGGNPKTSVEEYDPAVSPFRSDIEGKGDVAIGLDQVEIVITGTPTRVIRIQADASNTGTIYIGKTGVLADGSNDFVRLDAADEVILQYDDATNALYAISDTAAQSINVGAVL